MGIVSRVICSTLYRADFVVDAFQEAGQDVGVVPVQEAWAVGAEGLRNCLPVADAAASPAATLDGISMSVNLAKSL